MRSMAILGAGAGGCALAGTLTQRSYKINLHSRYASDLKPIEQRGGIEVVFKAVGKEKQWIAKPNIVTNDLREAVTSVELIMVVAPAIAHEYYAEELAPLLGENQVVFFNPGHIGSSLLFVSTLRKIGFNKPIVTCETARLPYACRQTRGPGMVEIYTPLKNLVFAAFPGKFTIKLAKELREVFPEIRPVKHVLEAAFSSMNPVLHPAPTILNAARIEHTKGDFYFFPEGISPSVARVMEALDEEKLNIMRALNIKPMTFVETFAETFPETGATRQAALSSGSIYQAVKRAQSMKLVKAPSSLDHRFVSEDVPFGLVPMTELGRLLRVQTPTMDLVIRLASLMNQTDYYKVGLTLDKMGLSRVRRRDLDDILMEGFE